MKNSDPALTLTLTLIRGVRGTGTDRLQDYTPRRGGVLHHTMYSEPARRGGVLHHTLYSEPARRGGVLHHTYTVRLQGFGAACMAPA